jgi:hypothetical protein
VSHVTISSEREQHLPEIDGPGEELSRQQAYEAAYRFIARSYDDRRITPILRLLETFSWPGEHPGSNEDAWASWQVCVEETLDGAPLPEPPEPWS